MISFLIVFFATYVATQVTTFSECKPFHLYWQVVPDPGKTAFYLVYSYVNPGLTEAVRKLCQSPAATYRRRCP